MSLDIAILASDGRPYRSVSLNPDQHFNLFGALSRKACPLLSRLEDYYQDAVFSIDEMPGLASELWTLQTTLVNHEEIEIVRRMLELVADARLQHKSLVAIAD
jgi:hypothetical protein